MSRSQMVIGVLCIMLGAVLIFAGALMDNGVM